jgi:hypothetical protein
MAFEAISAAVATSTPPAAARSSAGLRGAAHHVGDRHAGLDQLPMPCADSDAENDVSAPSFSASADRSFICWADAPETAPTADICFSKPAAAVVALPSGRR